jgi:hypothetical protein
MSNIYDELNSVTYDYFYNSSRHKEIEYYKSIPIDQYKCYVDPTLIIKYYGYNIPHLFTPDGYVIWYFDIDKENYETVKKLLIEDYESQYRPGETSLYRFKENINDGAITYSQLVEEFYKAKEQKQKEKYLYGNWEDLDKTIDKQEEYNKIKQLSCVEPDDLEEEPDISSDELFLESTQNGFSKEFIDSIWLAFDMFHKPLHNKSPTHKDTI